MRIVFFDIDGTLATRTEVPASAAEAIARLRANGDLVFICTGRARAYAERHFSAYADGFVCCNGRLAFSGDEHLYAAELSSAQVADIVADGKITLMEFMGFARRHKVQISPEDLPKYREQAKKLGFIK